MIDSVSSADVANAERFERIGIPADAGAAARTREEFARWLEDYFALDPTRFSDLLLATNEALANAAEFAYVLADRPGTIDVHAAYDRAAEKLSVTISDRGTWRPPDPDPVTRLRGRGIPLMEALTDHTSIDASRGGTRVLMEWAGVETRADLTDTA
jgi:anti-sigma regulatory factor (Ser/Thr protein kinase)